MQGGRRSQRRCRSPKEGWGLASAVKVRSGAHWASWADCLRMVWAQSLTEAGFVVSSWTSLAESEEVHEKFH